MEATDEKTTGPCRCVESGDSGLMDIEQSDRPIFDAFQLWDPDGQSDKGLAMPLAVEEIGP